MLYFLKPLTHNSQISGFLLRSFPSPYTVVDPSGCTLKVYEREEEVLVKVRIALSLALSINN